MRRLYQLVAAATILFLIVFAAALIIFQSDWFKNRVREKIIADVENATGGRVEIGSFNYNWHNFTADVAPFTLHGQEPATAPPLIRADRIQLSLKVISILQRKADISAIIVDKPKVHITVAPDGKTNFPTPMAVKRGGVIADILNLRIRRLTINNGVIDYNSQQIPLDLKADDFAAQVNYASNPPRYNGELSAHKIHLTSTTLHNQSFDVTAKLAIENDKITVRTATITHDQSRIQIAGNISDLSFPKVIVEVTSQINLKDLPVKAKGEVAFNGKASMQFSPFIYSVNGRLTGRDLAYRDLNHFAISSNLNAEPNLIKLTGIDLTGLSGHFRGTATVQRHQDLHIVGDMEGFSVQQLAALEGKPPNALNGTLTGPVEADAQITSAGLQDLKAKATLQIAPGKTGVPISGSVEAVYDERSGVLQVGNSNLTLGETVVTTSGNLGQTIAVHLTSSNLHNLLLAMPLIGQTPPQDFAIELVHSGTARFDGTVTGPLANPSIAGRLQLSTFQTEKHNFSRLDAAIDATKSSLNVQSLTAEGDIGHLEGDGHLDLANWTPVAQSTVAANIRLVQTHRQLFPDVPFTAAVNATAKVSGKYGDLHATARLQMNNAALYGESINQITADLSYADYTIELTNGHATSAKAQADFTGLYNYTATDWTTGHARFDLNAHNVGLGQLKFIADRREGIEGQLDAQATGAVHFIRGEFQLDVLDSRVNIRNGVIDGKPAGELEATAKTRGQYLDIRSDATLRGVQVHGQGEWRLIDDYPGEGQISIPRMTLATVRDFIRTDTGHDLPFGGFLSANIKLSVPLRNVNAFRADVSIPELQINSSPNTQPRAGAQPADLILRSARPVQFAVNSKGADIRSAQFVGTDTTLQLAGRVGFNDKDPWTARLNGSINLAILQLFNHDLLASGIADVNASVRGSISSPELNGRLELKNASLFLADLPTGVEKANGIIVFDRNRASVEKLTGESGGGVVTFQAGSFVGFSSGLLIYRVQATADHVRYRDPEGYSLTANGSLSLAGTSERSTLSGNVTVARAAFLPHTDVGSLLASTAKPISVPAAPNNYVRGIQFDVRVDCAQNLEVVTSLTRDIQVEANLRFRGNVERPILLGNVAINQGQIDFFGNKYRINRGEIIFNNPAKVEPLVDMDLETRVRGITVDVRFNGPLEKLNFSYRSDPPLESNQIIALLAVGREPVGIGALASSQATTNTSYLSTGGNALLSQAVTAPVSGRLQRFFGTSHIKIDPQLTDITSVPQARLQFEQQISKDITMTYITNVSRTSEQVVRVEWNLTRRWSVVAVRDENGLFGVDFQYRKTFK